MATNDRICIGCIGVGNMGTGNMKGFMKHPEVEIVAVCDVDSKNLSRAASAVMKAQGRMPAVHQDFRSVLDMAQARDVYMRNAAQMIAVDRVVKTMEARGWL